MRFQEDFDMWILARVDDTLVAKVLSYLSKRRVWFKKFPEKIYTMEVSAEDREERIRKTHSGSMNPPAAWETCKSMKKIWDWDNMDRGPWPNPDPKPNPAPHGKGWLMENGHRVRVAGECANPTMLNYISCWRWCPMYEPTTVEGQVFLMKQTAEEHEVRASTLRSQIIHLQQSEAEFEQSIKK